MATNPVAEEQYDLQRGLSMIRRNAERTGVRAPVANLTDPGFREVMFGSLLPGKKNRRTNADIKEAVNLWCSNRAKAEDLYGHISDWDVSRVTNMSELFRGKRYFNNDISRWNVSNVTRMDGMFRDADSFNQPIGGWDVSNVTDMNYMFASARAFNQNIGDWNTSNVQNMSNMFLSAEAFNQNLTRWSIYGYPILMFYGCGISRENKPAKVRDATENPWEYSPYYGGAKKNRRARRRASRKRSRKGRITQKRGARRTRRR
jgi:surface protein